MAFTIWDVKGLTPATEPIHEKRPYIKKVKEPQKNTNR